MKPFTRKLLIAFCIVLLIIALFGTYVWQGNPSDRPIEASMGTDPLLVEPEPRSIPSVGLVEPVGWGEGEQPVAAKGLAVTRFAEGLDHPRTLFTLPNGDVLVAETNAPPGENTGGLTNLFMRLFMKRIGVGGPSPDRIVLLRDADADGQAEQRSIFRAEDMKSPSGMAYGDGKLYIANHDAVLAFDFEPGATVLTGEPEKIMDLPAAGNHWMRNLLLSPEGDTLYVAVGSATNIADSGLEVEAGRAAIWEFDLIEKRQRQFAAGMRNPNGMAWNPSTGELWATVQERDMLGPDLVPDYLTNVPVGAQYGWPWVYWKDNFDRRVKHNMPVYMTEYTRRPEYALGAHTSALGMVFAGEGNRMGEDFANGAFIARHGSWNRKPPVGYDVIFVPFDAFGNPVGEARVVLGGFLADTHDKTRGRPTWLAWDQDGGLLVSDDTSGIIWRIVAPGAEPAAGPTPVETESLPPQLELRGDPASPLRGIIEDEYIMDPARQ